jgi:hypothetical protein
VCLSDHCWWNTRESWDQQVLRKLFLSERQLGQHLASTGRCLGDL